MLLNNLISGPVQQTIIMSIKDNCSPEEIKMLALLYEKVGDDTIWAAATVNRIHSIVAHRFMDILGEDNVPAYWRQAHEENDNRISAYLAELDRIAARLSEDAIALVALKNGGIARAIYPCPGCCPMGDLDVLVEKRYFRNAHRLLIEEGYQMGSRGPFPETDILKAEQDGGAEYRKELPDGDLLWFELQWRPIAGRWIRPDQEPDAEELLARSVLVAGTAVRLLAPEDNLLQVALHTAKHSYVRAPGVRLHLDVERIVRRVPIDWDVFVNRVKQFRVCTPVYFSLLIPKTLFGTPIPDRVLTELSPPRWKRHIICSWLERIGLFNPDEKKFSNIGFIFFSALLYDDLRGLLQSIFPASQWMRERYGVRNNLFLPYYHVKRLYDLILRRVLS